MPNKAVKTPHDNNLNKNIGSSNNTKYITLTIKPPVVKNIGANTNNKIPFSRVLAPRQTDIT